MNFHFLLQGILTFKSFWLKTFDSPSLTKLPLHHIIVYSFLPFTFYFPTFVSVFSWDRFSFLSAWSITLLCQCNNVLCAIISIWWVHAYINEWMNQWMNEFRDAFMSQTSVTYSPRSRQCAYEDIVPVLELLMGREKYGNKYSNVE